MPIATSLNAIPPLCHQADPRHPSAAGWSWWLLHCAAGREVGIADRLLDAGLPVLLPLCEYERRTSSRERRRTRRPIFDGYLFSAGVDECSRWDVLGALSGRQVQTYEVNPTDRASLLADLARLLDAVDAGLPLGKAGPAMVPGATRVRIVDGPFQGYEGTYSRSNSRGRLWLTVRFLAQSVPVPVELEPWQVEVVE